MFKVLKEKYKSLKSEYFNRSPRGKWHFVRNLGIFVLSFSGLAILDPNFKVWWYSYVAAFVTIDVSASFAYTLYYFADTPIQALLFTPLLSILVPVNNLS